MRTAILFFLLIATSVASSQNKDEVLKKHFKAHSQEFWDKINSISITGTRESDGKKLPFKLVAKRPNKILIKGKCDDEEYIEAYNGYTAWTIAPWTGIKTSQLMLHQEQLVLQSVFEFGSPLKTENDLEFKGEISENGVQCFWFARKDSNSECEFFLDKVDYKLLKLNRKEEVGGSLDLISKSYDEYRSFNGITLPSVLTIKTYDHKIEYTFDEILVGDGAPDRSFNKPQ